MSTSLRHCISQRTRAIGLEQLDESVTKAESGAKCAETCDAIVARGLCSEQLRPTFLSDTPVGHGHLQTIDTLQHDDSSDRMLSGRTRLQHFLRYHATASSLRGSIRTGTSASLAYADQIRIRAASHAEGA
jgi:hypothetical protein